MYPAAATQLNTVLSRYTRNLLSVKASSSWNSGLPYGEELVIISNIFVLYPVVQAGEELCLELASVLKHQVPVLIKCSFLSCTFHK